MDTFLTIQITFVLSIHVLCLSALPVLCDYCYCCDEGKEECLRSFSACTSCLDGYWGGQCRNECPPNCIACAKEPVRNMSDPSLPILYHVCTKCVDGKYLGGTNKTMSCTLNCPSYCKACTSFGNCSECKTGFYLENGECKACTSTCSACKSNTECLSCKSGYYGDKCDEACSEGCQGESCDQSTGSCSCKEGFRGLKCDQCASTYYGHYCNSSCSAFCRNRLCSRENGTCIECSSTGYTGYFCENCVNGAYGSTCNMSCPKNCKEYICQRLSGICLSCKANFAGTRCNNCIEGKFGVDCMQSCDENCKDRICDKDTGNCISCPDGLTGTQCDQCRAGLYSVNCSLPCLSANCFENICDRVSGSCPYCKHGWYGKVCNETCSKGCKYGNCSQNDGACDDGCLDQYSGDKCCVQNTNCFECLSKLECKTCVMGFYGTLCHLLCPVNCKNGCSKGFGICNGCTNDTYGMLCDATCPKTCKVDCQNSRRCNEISGECLIGCVNGFYGNLCRDRCNFTCSDHTCDYVQGVCLTGTEMFTSDEMTENLAIAIVVTSVLSILLTVAVMCMLRFVSTRLTSKQADQNKTIQSREQTVGPYAKLEKEQTYQVTDYDTLQNRNSDYANTCTSV